MPSYVGIGTSITHNVEVDGNLFLQDIEGGPSSTRVPLEIFSNLVSSSVEAENSRMLRLRVQNYGETNTDNSYVTDMGIRGDPGKDYFFITAPQNTSNVGDQNTFVISSTSNVGIGTTDPAKPLHVVGDSWITGTLTASNIIGASPVTISSNLVMASGFTLTAGAIEPPAGSESNLKITGTITTSNITHDSELTVTTNLLMGSDKTLTTSNIVANAGDNLLISSNLEVGTSNLFVDTTTGNVGIGITTPTKPLHVVGDSWITGTLTASNIIGASPVTISSNLVMASGFTLTAGAIEPPAGSESNLKITGTITTSNIVGSPSLTVTANTNVVAEFTASEKLIKYPTVKMTAATVSGFVASASSEYNSSWAAWKAFGLRDYSVSSGDSNVWASGSGTYNTVSGTYTGGVTTTATDGSEYAGEWLQIQLPTPIKLQYSQLFPRPGYPSIMPINGTILGGTNTTSWNSISSWENASYATGQYTRHNALTENYYDYYRLVVEDITGTGNQYLSVVEIADWELYGYPENDLGDGTSVLFKTVPNTPKTDFLDVYYDAKEYESGNITDESGNEVTGTIGSNVSYTSTEPKAWNFDGTVNGTVSASLTTPGGDWPHTHAIWFKADSVTTTQYTNTVGYFGTVATRQSSVMKISPTFIGFDFVNDSQDATLNVQTGIWYHAVFVYPGGGVNNAKIYVNGFDAGATGGSSTAISLPTSTALYLANQTNGSNPYFNGSIANYRLYDRSLSADEVWELYGNQKAYFSVSPDVVTYKAGRVGIGTSEPRAVLDVVGDVTTDGNVGIGKTNPDVKLDIKGSQFNGIGLSGSTSGRYNISTDAGGSQLHFTHGSYSWGVLANAHHYDVYDNSGLSGGSRDLFLNFYSGGLVRLTNYTVVTSDDRIKTNERYIENATETILKLKPQIYDKGPSVGGGGKTRVESGLIAQDVYYDAPELRHLVHYDEDAEIPDEKPFVDDDPQNDPDYSMWGSKSPGLYYEGFIAYLIKSNQEQQALIDNLDAQLQAEKQNMASLLSRIESLENSS